MTEIDAIPCDLFVDITGNDCMQPDSKLSDALAVLLPAQTLMAVSDKDALCCNISDFCLQYNLQLVGQGEADVKLYYLLRRSDA